MIGESPAGIPNNLMPYIAQVAMGLREKLRVFGNDYPTMDGTGVRDYIHVVDLAQGHVQALQALSQEQVLTLNLGTGVGYSVMQVLRAFEQACGRSIPFEVAPRRSGDVAQCYADPELAYRLLSWRASIGLEQMCRDAWNWQMHGSGD
jgi:UDP-glucose 4-epimerase